MTTLQASPDYDAATVVLTVAAAPAGAVVLTRTDANGTNTVRLRQAQVPIAGGMVVVDSEPALVGLVTYSCTDSAGATVSASVTFDGAPPQTGRVLRRNLLTNPSFETDTAAWGSARGAIAASASSSPVVGSKVLHYTADGTAGGNYVHVTPRPAVTPGLPYAAAASVRFPGTIRSVHLDLVWIDAAGAAAGAYAQSPTVSIGAAFTRLEVVGIAPANAATVQVRILAVLTMAAGEAMQVDAAQLDQASAVAPYVDGSTADTAQEISSWTGTAHASATEVLEVVGPAVVDFPRLHAVQLPQLLAMPEVITGYASARETSSTVHRPINREDPVIVLGPTRLRDGRLTTRHRDYQTAQETAGVLSAGPVMLRQADYPGLDMHLVASRVSVEPVEASRDGWHWTVAADYVETKSPNLPLLGSAGWSFDDVTAGYSSFLALRGAFATFGDLVVGP